MTHLFARRILGEKSTELLQLLLGQGFIVLLLCALLQAEQLALPNGRLHLALGRRVQLHAEAAPLLLLLVLLMLLVLLRLLLIKHLLLPQLALLL